MALITHKIEISIKSVVQILLLLLGIYFLLQIRDIILFIFIGILLMAALSPAVAKFESWKMSRGFSIALAYILLILILSAFIALIVPPLVSQTVLLLSQIPIPPEFATIFNTATFSLQDFQIIANQLNSVPKILGVVGSAFSGIIVFVSLLVFSFYLLVERANLSKHLHNYYQDEVKTRKAEHFIAQVESQIGGWFRAEATLMVVVGVMTYVGLLILQIPYALPLAIIAGLLEVLPNIGPVLSAFPAVIVSFLTVSPTMAVGVAILYVIVQQLENNLIVPMVMRQAVGLSPVITITLLLVGYRLAGVAGAALAIPLFLVGKVIVSEMYKLRNQLE
jgi:predicted PurR-regulated permease PerM